MNENLLAKIKGRLGNLADDEGRQVLDYIEFLESKFNRSTRTPSTVQRLAENIEDRIGGVRLSDVAAKGTAQVVEAAGKLMEGLAAASRVVAEELQVPPGQGNGEGRPAPKPAAPPPASDGASDPAPPEEPPAPA
jgi:hypothetical protein